VLRFLRRLLLLLLVVALAAAGAVYFGLRASLPRLDGDVALDGLRAAVTVERDAKGIATIHASDRLDLARATGFLHGQERFFQMDLLRRAGAGELSELVGAVALDTDRHQRRHRMRDVARKALASAKPEEVALLQAYTDGVNAGLRALTAKPFEYYLLKSDPRPWSVDDSELVVYAMFFDLTDEDGDRELKIQTIRDSLPPEVAQFLMPPGTQWDAPIVGEARTPSPIPAADVYDLHKLTGVEFPEFNATGGGDFSWRGSNNWVVAGSHTQSGGALLAGDMHLGLSVPHIWYRVRFVLDGPQPLDLTGVSLPGAPFMIAGSNTHIAWAFTNSYGDWTDLVTLELDPNDATRYRTTEGFKSLETIDEVIHVHNAPDEHFKVDETIWGPVLKARDGKLYAVHWLAHEPAAINLHIAWLEQAHDVNEAIAVANESGLPPQNFVVGDRDGHIGWSIAGRIPVRKGFDGVAPASWADGAGWDWLPADQYPRVIDPPAGRIWSANNRIVGGEMLAKIGDGGYDHGARAGQIRDDLMKLDKATPQDMLATQLDDRAVFLTRWRDLLLDVLNPDALAGRDTRVQAKRLVETWGAHAAIDSVGYRVVKEWRALVHDAAFAAITAPCRVHDREFIYGRSFQDEGPLWLLVTQQPMHLLNPHYAGWREFLLAAVDAVIDPLAKQPGGLAARTWGERNTLRMQHPLSKAVPALARFLDMPIEQLPGDSNMPRVQGPTFGASQRMAVTPGRESEALFEMPGGQSGHPLSPYYRAGHEDWAHGNAAPFLPGAAEHTLQLKPR
jgi:penicillin amidase